MAAQEVAQSVPRSFTGMIRPDLAIGSPERAAFFKECRRTFCDDWRDAGEAYAAERLARDDLYFIRAGNAVKIGHTVNIVNRLGKMQADNHEELNCLLLLNGRGHEEREWHRRFKRHHLRGEWFKWSPELEMAISEARESMFATVL